MLRGRRRRWRRLFHACCLLAGTLPAAGAAAEDMLLPLEVDDLPGWAEEDAAAALAPFRATCRVLARRTPEQPLGGAGALAEAGGSPAAWLPACAEAAALRKGQERPFLERRFRPVAIGTGLLTGYYEPILAGTLDPDPARPTPLMGLPAFRGGRLPDRAGIEGGALEGQVPHLAYVDPVEAFFLHIQGSGRVVLPDGTLLRLGHAGQNGHPYRSIGRILIQRGAIPRERMSMQAIREWLAAAPPAAATALLHENPSFIFFRLTEDLRPDQGPPGALGVPLTPERSIAIDPAHIPYGAPIWLMTRDPVDGRPIRRLVHAQDTGGAIRGPARGDFFWGWGDAAGAKAGVTRDEATLFVLVPREAPPLAAPPPPEPAVATVRTVATPRRAAPAGHAQGTLSRRRQRTSIAGMLQTRPRVALFVTCLVDLYRPNVGFSAIKLLEDAGCLVEVPAAQTCCGQPAYNTGDRATARDLARGVVDAFLPYDYTVVPSGSCGGQISHHYPGLFADDPEYRGKAEALAARTHELVSFLTDVLGVESVAARYDGTVTYHDSCSGLRELGIKAQPRRLLGTVQGVTLAEMPDAEICCGFGGTFCVKYPDISTRMVSDKTAAIVSTGADTLLAGDMGCLLNMAGRLKREGAAVKVRHVAEVLAGRTGEAPAIGEAP